MPAFLKNQYPSLPGTAWCLAGYRLHLDEHRVQVWSLRLPRGHPSALPEPPQNLRVRGARAAPGPSKGSPAADSRAAPRVNRAITASCTWPA